MENIVLPKINKVEPLVFSFDQCEKEYKRKSSITRHVHTRHEPIDVTLCKMKLKNSHLLLQVTLFTDQIKFLKKLILIQEHTLRINDRHTTRPSGLLNSYNSLTGIRYGSG